jgi:hypothetical protein
MTSSGVPLKFSISRTLSDNGRKPDKTTKTTAVISGLRDRGFHAISCLNTLYLKLTNKCFCQRCSHIGPLCGSPKEKTFEVYMCSHSEFLFIGLVDGVLKSSAQLSQYCSTTGHANLEIDLLVDSSRRLMLAYLSRRSKTEVVPPPRQSCWMIDTLNRAQNVHLARVGISLKWAHCSSPIDERTKTENG